MIKTDIQYIQQIIETVKSLPVRGTFDDADKWVGIVVALERLISNAENTQEEE